MHSFLSVFSDFVADCAKLTVTSDGKLVLKNLPFQAGDKVEVTVREQPLSTTNRYPLRETAVRYTAPFDSVDEDAWSALK